MVFLEIVYKDVMELEFILKGVTFSREREHKIRYKGQTLKHRFFTDFVLFDNIIIEVKANADGINNEAIAQTLNYLKPAASSWEWWLTLEKEISSTRD